MPVDLVRDAAVDAILRVFESGAHLDVSVDRTLRRRKLSDRGRRFMTQLVYGTVRHKTLCDFHLQRVYRNDIAELPPAILCILRMGVFQSLFCNQVTFPAMVHTSVDLARKRGHAGLAKLANAVLRRAPVSIEAVELPDKSLDLVEYLRVRYSMPAWIIESCLDKWGAEATEVFCAAMNEPAPTCIRVNTCKTKIEELEQRLQRSGFTLQKRTPLPEELTLLEGPPPVKTKSFMEGHYLLQDPASLLPGHLMEPRAGENVLDLCAAPGGKATHMAQLAGDSAHIVALDATANRLVRVAENCERMGLKGISLLCGDGLKPPLKSGFDKVLVDAPCSGLGTLRRHPDLKWRMGTEDIARLAKLQEALLLSAVDLCKNGGLLVYSVCTFTRQETSGVVQAVLERGGVESEDGPEHLKPWRTAQGEYQTNPSVETMDGFYLMRFRKRS